MQRHLAALLFLLAWIPFSHSRTPSAAAHLIQTRDALEKTVAELTPAQLAFKPSPDRWSVADIVEHITTTETLLMDTVETEVMSGGPPTETSDPTIIDQEILAFITDRSRRFKAPEVLHPSKSYGDALATLDAFRARRAATLAFATQHSTEKLRSHSKEHPLGKTLDAHQWLLFISGHCERHTEQIKEILADPAFPQ